MTSKERSSFKLLLKKKTKEELENLLIFYSNPVERLSLETKEDYTEKAKIILHYLTK